MLAYRKYYDTAYALRITALENQILAGDGAGENLQGILSTPGVIDVAFSAAQALADLGLEGITDVLLLDGEPNGVVVNPATWARLLTPKAEGSGEYLNIDSPFGTQADTLWGLPVVKSSALPADTLLVGDFAQGATLFVREGVNLRISDADQDDWVRNRLTFLGEGRYGLAVWRPACFAVVRLA